MLCQKNSVNRQHTNDIPSSQVCRSAERKSVLGLDHYFQSMATYSCGPSSLRTGIKSCASLVLLIRFRRRNRQSNIQKRSDRGRGRGEGVSQEWHTSLIQETLLTYPNATLGPSSGRPCVSVSGSSCTVLNPRCSQICRRRMRSNQIEASLLNTPSRYARPRFLTACSEAR